MEHALRLYRLVPDAPPDDPNWQNSLRQGEVVVRAVSPGDARLVAAEAEGDFPELAAKPAEGVSTTQASAFLNEKLFTVVLEPEDPGAPPGPRGLVEGAVETLPAHRPFTQQPIDDTRNDERRRPMAINEPRNGLPGTTEQSPRWEGPQENRPRGYLPAKDDPDVDRDAVGENLQDPRKETVTDAMKTKDDRD